MNKTFCIAGAGTYGSYLANALLERYPFAKIILIDVGNKNIKSESEIGFSSSLKENRYNAASSGRFFGLGGTSDKWGGQLLFLSENDCKFDPNMDYIKKINDKYYNKVLNRFFKIPPLLTEKRLENRLYIKSGIWLQFNKRNLFKYFKLNRKSRIVLITNARVKAINRKEEKVTSISIIKDEREEEIIADIFYITCGALESMRLLSESGFLNFKTETEGFADHISTRCFTVRNLPPVLCGYDFTYKFIGGSLITSRIIGEIDGASFYMQPVFNEKFIFFQVVKNLLFRKNFSLTNLLKALKQFVHLFPFAFQYIFKKQLYVYKTWDINIDIEINESNNYITFSDKKDIFGLSGIDIHFMIPNAVIAKMESAKSTIRSLLEKEGYIFTELGTDASSLKYEDTYHPYKMYNKTKGLKKRFNPLENLYVCNTGILDRAGGLNPTAVLFCLLESHIETDL